MAAKDRHPFEARLGAWPAERLAKILAKRVDRMLVFFPAQLEMDMAHTVMLAEQDILSRDDAARILEVLVEIRDGGPESLHIESVRSTLFWYVEATLIDRLGEQLGGRMHTGRSHNDIQPTISRMTARSELLGLLDILLRLRTTTLDVAAAHTKTVMPGYTSLQHGQPWTFGHYLSGWADAFERDFGRLVHGFGTTDLSPLGASALAGTSWPLDRERVAHLLGFGDVIVNSRDAGFGTKDYVAEILAAVSILMINLGTLCSDLYLWSSFEFGMVELDGGYSGSSSMMPQKKNPWAVDWARGAAGNAIGHFASSLGAMKGASSTDGSAQDFPETPLAESLETAADYLDLIDGVLATLDVKAEVMAERAGTNWTTASNLADTIVREAGLSFREAHGIVGRLVRSAMSAGRVPRETTTTSLDEAAVDIIGRPLGLTEQTIRTALDPMEFLSTRVTIGSVNPKEVRRMIARSRVRLRRDRRWHEERAKVLARARIELDDAVLSIRATARVDASQPPGKR